tara:strand:- start:98 stop:457 length:360 start_codon:yes stop_codon:yes gene_type:complete
MNSFFIALLALSLTGCSSLRYAGSGFSSSTSTCVDGALVNIDAAGCKEFYLEEKNNDKTFRVKCKRSDLNNFWTMATFEAIPQGGDTNLPDSFKPFCSDSSIILYVHDTRKKSRSARPR